MSARRSVHVENQCFVIRGPVLITIMEGYA